MKIQSSVCFFLMEDLMKESLFFCMYKGLLAEHAVVYETNMLGNRKTIDRYPKENTHIFVLRDIFLFSQHEN